MREKKYIVISRIFALFTLIMMFSYIGITATSQLNSYSLGVKTGEVYGWRVAYIDSNAMTEAFGYEYLPNEVGYGDEVGSTFKIKITDILIWGNNWKIIYEYSKWTYGFIFEDQGLFSELVPMDPFSNEIWFGLSFCPKPVSEYLSHAFWGSDYRVSGTSVLKLSHYLYHVGNKVHTLLTYTNSGILTSFKYIYNDNTIYEVVLYNVIVEELMLILVLIALIALIAIIIIHVKKRKKLSLKSNQIREVVKDNKNNSFQLTFF